MSTKAVEWREEQDARARAIWCSRLDGWGSSPTDRLERWGTEPERWLRRVPGRETLVVRAADGAPVVLKCYVGDERRDAWYERLRGRAPRSPARREFQNLVALASAGLPVPRPLGLCEARRGTGRASLVCMELVEHDETLVERLAEGLGERARERSALLELVVRLHREGWYHRDLYLQHVLWTAGGAVLIDVGRARRETRPRTRWFVKDLAALWHSAPPAIGAHEARAFLDDYLAARAVPSAERDRWRRSIVRKARRIARHAPRWVDAERSARVGEGR